MHLCPDILWINQIDWIFHCSGWEENEQNKWQRIQSTTSVWQSHYSLIRRFSKQLSFLLLKEACSMLIAHCVRYLHSVFTLLVHFFPHHRHSMAHWNVVLAPTNGITKHITIIHSIFKTKREKITTTTITTTLNQNDSLSFVWTFNAIQSENFSTWSSCGILKMSHNRRLLSWFIILLFFSSYSISLRLCALEMGFWFVTFLTPFNKGGKKLCWRLWILDDDSHATIVSLNTIELKLWIANWTNIRTTLFRAKNYCCFIAMMQLVLAHVDCPQWYRCDLL